MLNNKTKLIAKIDPLKYLLSKVAFTGHIAKWVMMLRKFDIEYVDRKSIKGQIIANQLVDAPLQGHHPLITKFPDDSIMSITQSKWWQMYFDGSCTQHGSRAGILLITPQGDCILKSYKIEFSCVNNIVEYESLITRLCLVIQWIIIELQLDGDYQLGIKQVNDKYQTKVTSYFLITAWSKTSRSISLLFILKKFWGQTIELTTQWESWVLSCKCPQIVRNMNSWLRIF